MSLLGVVGGALAVVGVVVCPVSSGDTAFRSARLTIADWFHIDQSPLSRRLAVTLPLLAVGACLTQVDFDVVWRYFSWSNQTLAMIALWAAAMYLVENAPWPSGPCAPSPATFMSAVSAPIFSWPRRAWACPSKSPIPSGRCSPWAAPALFAVGAARKKNGRSLSGERKV